MYISHIYVYFCVYYSPPLVLLKGDRVYHSLLTSFRERAELMIEGCGLTQNLLTGRQGMSPEIGMRGRGGREYDNTCNTVHVHVCVCVCMGYE